MEISGQDGRKVKNTKEEESVRNTRPPGVQHKNLLQRFSSSSRRAWHHTATVPPLPRLVAAALNWTVGWNQKQLSLHSSTRLERIFRFGSVQSDGTKGSFCGFLQEANRPASPLLLQKRRAGCQTPSGPSSPAACRRSFSLLTPLAASLPRVPRQQRHHGSSGSRLCAWKSRQDV